MGYHRAGFEVFGVDIKPQPRYPFQFYQGDAIEFCLAHGKEFDVIHASPPCQAHSCIRAILTEAQRAKHQDLIEPTRAAIAATGKPYIIENVYGARHALLNPVMLCGTFFGLKVYRHRLFECSPYLLVPPHSPHQDKSPGAGNGLSPKGFITVCGGGRGTKLSPSALNSGGFVSVAGHVANTDYCRWAMGIDWMTGRELSQAIPPSYTEYLGIQVLNALDWKVSAVG
jgi:DNA (cytosine-5)-methyltransferase 1